MENKIQKQNNKAKIHTLFLIYTRKFLKYTWKRYLIFLSHFGCPWKSEVKIETHLKKRRYVTNSLMHVFVNWTYKLSILFFHVLSFVNDILLVAAHIPLSYVKKNLFLTNSKILKMDYNGNI